MFKKLIYALTPERIKMARETDRAWAAFNSVLEQRLQMLQEGKH